MLLRKHPKTVLPHTNLFLNAKLKKMGKWSCYRNQLNSMGKKVSPLLPDLSVPDNLFNVW